MNMKLYNDDCLNVLKDIEDNSIDLVVSDPPYKTTSRGKSGKYRDWETDRKSTRLNSSHSAKSRMPSSA